MDDSEGDSFCHQTNLMNIRPLQHMNPYSCKLPILNEAKLHQTGTKLFVYKVMLASLINKVKVDMSLPKLLYI